MREHEIELAAAGKRDPLKDMSISEECLSIGLKGLYALYFTGRLSREDAAARKKILLGKCRNIEQNYDSTLAVYREHQDNIRKAGQLLREIEHENDVAQLALKACWCIGLMTGDQSFYKRQLRKVELYVKEET